MTSIIPAALRTSWLWKSLTSIRLTIFLLLVLALIALLGTLLPQGEPPGYYVARFGEGLGSFLGQSGLTRIYSSPWFLGPMALFTLNLLACLLQGLPQAIKRVSQPFTGEMAAALPERGRFTWPVHVNPQHLVAGILRAELGRPRQTTAGNREFFLVERGRFRPLGPYIIHLSLLFILLGGLIGKFWGVEGRLPIHEGGVAKGFLVQGSHSETPMPFQLRLDRFQVSFYPNGTPEEFRSDLTFLQDGQEVKQGVCRVNDPVSFGGLTFYQSSYGSEPTGPVRLEVCRGNDCHTVETPLRRLTDLPGGQGQMVVVRLEGNLQGLGPAVQVAYKNGPGHPLVFWVAQDHPQLAGRPQSPFWQPGELRFTLKSLPFRYFSVLQVKRDPGVWWVYTGFVLLLPGFLMAFLWPHQRWAVVLEQQPGGGWQGRLLGASPRAREAFAARQERVLLRLKKGGQP